MGYFNSEGFVAPFEGARYRLQEYRGANQLPRNAKELFNNRHASLGNAIQKSFHVLKTRFPILTIATQYAFQTQRDIVIAACVIHNFIRREERNDWLFNGVEGKIVEELPDEDDQLDPLLSLPNQEPMGYDSRDIIAAEMWNDFINVWDQW